MLLLSPPSSPRAAAPAKIKNHQNYQHYPTGDIISLHFEPFMQYLHPIYLHGLLVSPPHTHIVAFNLASTTRAGSFFSFMRPKTVEKSPRDPPPPPLPTPPPSPHRSFDHIHIINWCHSHHILSPLQALRGFGLRAQID